MSWLMRRSDSASSSRGRASDTFMLRFSVLERPPVMALFTLKQTYFCHTVIVNAADNSPSRSYTKVVLHAFEPGVRSAMLCMLKIISRSGLHPCDTMHWNASWQGSGRGHAAHKTHMRNSMQTEHLSQEGKGLSISPSQILGYYNVISWQSHRDSVEGIEAAHPVTGGCTSR